MLEESRRDLGQCFRSSVGAVLTRLWRDYNSPSVGVVRSSFEAVLEHF